MCTNTVLPSVVGVIRAVWTVPLTGGPGHHSVVRCTQTQPMRLRRTQEQRSRRGTISAHIGGQNEVSLTNEL